MIRRILFLTVLFALGVGNVSAREYRSEVWCADNGDGTYRNPILPADYSDPDVVRVGDDYWMTASSFQCVPGLPILHSKDLVNWTLVNHALPHLAPESFFAQTQPGRGVWAPCIKSTTDSTTSTGAIPTSGSTWSAPTIRGAAGRNPCWCWRARG